MSINFDKEVLVMDAIFGFFEIAGEELNDDEKDERAASGYKLTNEVFP